MNLNNWEMKHSKEVNQLLKAQEKLEELVNSPAPDMSGLYSEKTLEKALDAMINHSLVSGHERVRAVNQARGLIDRKLNQAVQENLDDYLSQAAESFDKAAEQYEENIYELPASPFTAEQALGFGREQRDAYEKVCDAAGVLEGWMNWALELTDLPAEGLGPWSKFFTIVSPETVGGLVVLQLEESTTGNPAWDRTLPVVAKAVREGACLRLASPSTARRDADRVEEERQGMSDEAERLLRSGLGF